VLYSISVLFISIVPVIVLTFAACGVILAIKFVIVCSLYLFYRKTPEIWTGGLNPVAGSLLGADRS